MACAKKSCAKKVAVKKVTEKKVADKAATLAINGGKKVWSKGFPAWPQFDKKTDKAVLDILHSGKVNYWTGKIGMQFESEKVVNNKRNALGINQYTYSTPGAVPPADPSKQKLDVPSGHKTAKSSRT